MNEQRLRVLLVEDDHDDYIIVRDMLREIPRTKFEIDRATTYEEALEAMEHGRYEVCILDYRLGEHNGLELLQYLRRRSECRFPIILLTGKGDYEVDVEAMKAGAADYLVKDRIDPDLLERVIRYAVERWRSEEKQARLMAAIEQTEEIIIITDCEGIVQYVNSALERISGFSYEDVVGRDAGIIKSAQHGPELVNDIEAALKHGEIWKGRFENRKKDGTCYEVEATISPVRNRSGTIINYVAVERDVTHEVQLEKQLWQSQKMEALGTLAGGIAHDFKNLLIPIMLHTELALCEPELKSPIRDSLEQVLQSCRNAGNMVKQILTFSRPETEKRRALGIGLLIQDTLRLVEPILPKSIEIRRNITVPDGVDTVLADPTQIQQVIMNLFNNAVQAMHEKGGVLEISLDAIDFDPKGRGQFPLELAPGSYVRLSVADTGHGMESAVIEKIFEPFYTARATKDGIGLGLSVAYGIVKRHGGAISVSSQPGKGSVLDVFFPRIQACLSDNIQTDTTSRAIPKGKERILFVDDEKAVCESVRQILTHLGYEATIAAGGHAALEIFCRDANRFDLLITDHAMPGITGIQLARIIRRIRPDLPIILCTALQTISTGEAGEAGIGALLPKPVTLREMAESIRRALDRYAVSQ